MQLSLRLSGVAAVLVIWTSLSVATVVASFDLLGDRPLSYLGSRPDSSLLFTTGLAASALLLMVFHRHVRDRYPVSGGFSLAMLVGLAGQVVAAFVPIGGDPTVHGVHTTSALVLGASLPLLMWRFAAAQPPGPWRRRSYALFWAEAVACAGGLSLSALNIAPVAEILPAAVFHAWIVTVTFAGARAVSATGLGLERPQRRVVDDGQCLVQGSALLRGGGDARWGRLGTAPTASRGRPRAATGRAGIRPTGARWRIRRLSPAPAASGPR